MKKGGGSRNAGQFYAPSKPECKRNFPSFGQIGAKYAIDLIPLPLQNKTMSDGINLI
jgi:hypothetical protein